MKQGCTARITLALEHGYAEQMGWGVKATSGSGTDSDAEGSDAEGSGDADGADGVARAADGAATSNGAVTPAAGTAVRITVNEQHCNHAPGTLVDMLSLPTDGRVMRKIDELVSAGVKTGALNTLIAKHGREFALQDGIPWNSSCPDPRYVPPAERLHRLIALAKRRRRLHKYDLPAVIAWVAEERRRDASTFWDLQTGEQGGTKFRLVLQTKEMRDMLQRYGQHVVCMDATYKTTKWGQPLFLITVVDNHGKGYPAALFVLEDESEASITGALEVIKGWNPGWRPEHVMVDKCDAEINAVESVFPRAKVLLCDFHRLQAWWRWINKSENGVPPSRCAAATVRAAWGFARQIGNCMCMRARTCACMQARVCTPPLPASPSTASPPATPCALAVISLNSPL